MRISDWSSDVCSSDRFAALFAPGLAVLYGWNNVLGLALIPLVLVMLIYTVYAKDNPDTAPAKTLSQYLAILKDKDAWWFMFRSEEQSVGQECVSKCRAR